MEAEARRRSGGFSLRLEQGRGRLVLHRRLIADLFMVEVLRLGLKELPFRLDLSTGVERFRHQRAELEQLRVQLSDQRLSQLLSQRSEAIQDLEVRALDGDLVFLGALGEGVPFMARARLEPAGIAGERLALISFYEMRFYGAAPIPPPKLAQLLLDLMGFESDRVGPTTAAMDPTDRLLYEICAELGWKLPERSALRLQRLRAEGGEIYLNASLPERRSLGPRDLQRDPGDLRLRRFLSDYEAKTLYASLEQELEQGEIGKATAGYERQLELHPEQPFLQSRLLQLLALRLETAAEGTALARKRLIQDPEDPEALIALAGIQSLKGELSEAAQFLGRLAHLAEARGDPMEAAQALCGIATLRREEDPQTAIQALERALELRRSLPGALRILAELHEQIEDWAAALRLKERLLERLEEPQQRLSLLYELGQLALTHAKDQEAAQGYFEQALNLSPEEIPALEGLAEAHQQSGQLLPALRCLDRAAQLLQRKGETARAAQILARLGDLWREVPDGGSTATLRYRQAMLLVPGQLEALSGLAEIAAAAGEAARARGWFEEILRRSQERSLGVDRPGIHLRLARLLSGPLKDEARALPHFQKVLKEGDSSQRRAALEALERIYSTAGRWGDVARLVQLSLRQTEAPKERVERLCGLAEIFWRRLEDPQRAEELLLEAEALFPGDLQSLQALTELYRASEEHERLAEVLGRLTEAMDDPEQLPGLYSEWGDLFRVQLLRPEEAIAAYTLALGCQADHPSGLSGLIEVLRAQERNSELAPLLSRRARQLQDPQEQGQLYLELGRLQEEALKQPRRALHALEAARACLPQKPEVLRRLARLYSEQGMLAEAQERLRCLAALAQEREDWSEAQSAYTQLLELAEAQPEDELALALLELRLGSFEQAQGRLLNLPDSPSRRHALVQSRLALGEGVKLGEELKILLSLEDPELLHSATPLLPPESREAVWRRLLELNPKDEEAQAALWSLEDVAKLLDSQEEESAAPEPEDDPPFEDPQNFQRHSEKPEISKEQLRLRIQEAETEEEQANAWLALAEHQRDQLHDPMSSILAFEQALEYSQQGMPAWDEALEALEDIYSIREDWDSLLVLYDRRQEAGGDPSELALLRASILRASGRLEEAIAAAEEAQILGERSLNLRQDLLLEAGRLSEAAALLLEGTSTLSPKESAQREWQAASLLSKEKPQEALPLFEQAFKILEDPQLLDEWSTLAESCGAWDARLAIRVAQAERYSGEGAATFRRSSLFKQAAELAVEEGDDLLMGRALLEQALAAWPENIEALISLESCLEALGDLRALAANWKRQHKLSLPGSYRGALSLKLAKLYLHELRDPEEAWDFAELALADLDGRLKEEAQALLNSLMPDDDDLVGGESEALNEELLAELRELGLVND